eukprot:2618653-Rhodomonas_salina.1
MDTLAKDDYLHLLKSTPAIGKMCKTNADLPMSTPAIGQSCLAEGRGRGSVGEIVRDFKRRMKREEEG